MDVMDNNHKPSPFLLLPPELRLSIYDILLTDPTSREGEDQETAIDSSACASSSHTPTLRIRTEDPVSFSRRQQTCKQTRTRFLIRSDLFRGRCMWTTYHLASSPVALSTPSSLLLANSRVHAECAQRMYSSFCFDFGMSIEAIVPFLSDLTPQARSHIRHISLTKRALPGTKQFDAYEWTAALAYISTHLSGLHTMTLNIVAGKPDVPSFLAPQAYSRREMEQLIKDRDTRNGGDNVDESGDGGMEWIGDLLRVRGLRKLEVNAIVQHCPMPMSKGMAVFVRFSASVEGAFARFLRERMVIGGGGGGGESEG